MEMRPNVKAILPRRMRARPIDHRGFPVPWFVTERDTNGNWDFRPITLERQLEALRDKRCWICGDVLGRFKAFAVGPICGINRTSAEPPQHRECAEFAVRACPFMVNPAAKRSDRNMIGTASPAEGGLSRNPGCSLVWTTESFKLIPIGAGLLFRMGPPVDVSFWCRGRTATRDEIDASVAGGISALDEAAERDGPKAVELLAQYKQRFEQLLPAR